MKPLKTLLLLFLAACAGPVFPQSESRLTLSDAMPEIGKPFKLTYKPAGGPMVGKHPLGVRLYLLDKGKNPVEDVSMKLVNGVYECDITLKDSVKAFVATVTTFMAFDSNDGKGFVYLVGKNGKPVEGAYAQRSQIVYYADLLNIKADHERALSDLENEFKLYPQSKGFYMYSYYSLIMNPVFKGKYKHLLDEDIASLKTAKTEQEFQKLIYLHRVSGSRQKADSVSKIAIKRFPKGMEAKSALNELFYSKEDRKGHDSVFNAYSKTYGNDENLRRMATYFLLTSLQENNSQDFARYVKQADTSYLEGRLNGIAWDWALKGTNLKEAERLSKWSLNRMEAKIAKAESSWLKTAAERKSDYQWTLDMYTDTYAYILYKQGRYTEAIKYQAPVWERDKFTYVKSEHYGLMLAAAKNPEATEIIEDLIKAGKGSDELATALKEAYMVKHTNADGFDAYLTALQNIGRQKALEELKSKMINEAAPGFSLKDLNGNTVSLAALKGKVVVLDFWATWCGPCIASFPAMQKAVNKFKDNKDVQFLFIDTWESGKDFVDKVKKFIGDNKYNFTVLLDEKLDDGKQAKVVTDYKVRSIPAKFVIDKNGNIRFRVSGGSSGGEAVAELSNMIELAGREDVKKSR